MFDFLGSRTFWAIVVLALGAGMLVNGLFKTDFPIGKILFGGVLVLAGIQVLTGKRIFPARDESRHQALFAERNQVVFGRQKVLSEDIRENGTELAVVFGEQLIDLRDLDTLAITFLEVSTVFGESTIYVRQGQAYVLEVSSVFAGVRLPNGEQLSFGDKTYRSAAATGAEKPLRLKVDVVFGSVRVIEEGGLKIF